MRRGRRAARVAKITLLVSCCIVFIPVVIPLVRVGVECRVFARADPPVSGGAENAVAAATVMEQTTAGLSGYARSEDQTYLTLPEWYIVYSADEYAAFIAENRPSRFPYFEAVEQYWQTYYNVCAVTRGQYPFNSGYHLSLAVTGASFTIENNLKGLYEVTFGRATEWMSSRELTAEDAYARKVAAEYGDFIHTTPWYEFPFASRLRGLWGGTPLWGPNVIRKWERKIALSLEYGTKSIYGWLIKRATGTVYATEDREIYVWAEGIADADQVLRQEPQIRIVQTIDADASIVALPRYEAFSQIVPRLVRQGVQFIEIAGNDEILITVIAPRDWQYESTDGTFLFAMPLPTQPDLKRVAVKAPVRVLHRVLSDLQMQSSTIEIEHIYDY